VILQCAALALDYLVFLVLPWAFAVGAIEVFAAVELVFVVGKEQRYVVAVVVDAEKGLVRMQHAEAAWRTWLQFGA